MLTSAPFGNSAHQYRPARPSAPADDDEEQGMSSPMNNLAGFQPNALDLNDKYAYERRFAASGFDGFSFGGFDEQRQQREQQEQQEQQPVEQDEYLDGEEKPAQDDSFLGFHLPPPALGPVAAAAMVAVAAAAARAANAQPQQPQPQPQPQPAIPSLEAAGEGEQHLPECLPIAETEHDHEEGVVNPTVPVPLVFSPRFDAFDGFEGKEESAPTISWEGWDDLLHDEVQPGSTQFSKPDFGSLDALINAQTNQPHIQFSDEGIPMKVADSQSFYPSAAASSSSSSSESNSTQFQPTIASLEPGLAMGASSIAANTDSNSSASSSSSSSSEPGVLPSVRPALARRSLLKGKEGRSKRGFNRRSLPLKPKRTNNDNQPMSLPSFYDTKPETHDLNWRRERKRKLDRYRQRRTDTMHKRVLYPIRQRFAIHRPRIGGRFVKIHGVDDQSVNQQPATMTTHQLDQSPSATSVSSFDLSVSPLLPTQMN